MLKKQNHAKDTKGLRSGANECSTNRNIPQNDILFVSSNGEKKDQTFSVRNSPWKKVDLDTIGEDLQTRKKTVAARRRNNANPKGKGKLGEYNFIGSRKMRTQQRRPLTSRGQRNAITHKERKVWEKKRPDGRAAQNGKLRIHSQR